MQKDINRVIDAYNSLMGCSVSGGPRARTQIAFLLRSGVPISDFEKAFRVLASEPNLPNSWKSLSGITDPDTFDTMQSRFTTDDDTVALAKTIRTIYCAISKMVLHVEPLLVNGSMKYFISIAKQILPYVRSNPMLPAELTYVFFRTGKQFSPSHFERRLQAIISYIPITDITITKIADVASESIKQVKTDLSNLGITWKTASHARHA